MKIKTRWLIIACAALAPLAACNPFGSGEYLYNDTHGVRTAEAQYEINERLLVCAANLDCPQRPEALFWKAVIPLSREAQKPCQWGFNQQGRLAPMRVIEDINSDADLDALTLNDWNRMSEAEHDAAVNDFVSSATRKANFQCDYDETSDTFRASLSDMKAAVDAGSHFAANELGLIYLTDPELFEPQRAYDILKSCAPHDGICAYNFARALSLTNPEAHLQSLRALETAAQISPNKEIDHIFWVMQSHYDTPNNRADAKAKLGRLPEYERRNVIREFEISFPFAAQETAR